MAGRYHTRVFVEWRRLHQVVTLLLPPPTEVVTDESPANSRPVSAAGKLSSSASPGGAAVVSLLPQDPPLPVQLYDRGRRGLYARSHVDGRWRYGRLLATSVSDTAAGADTGNIHRQPFDV